MELAGPEYPLKKGGQLLLLGGVSYGHMRGNITAILFIVVFFILIMIAIAIILPLLLLSIIMFLLLSLLLLFL